MSSAVVQSLIESLRKKRWRLALAESCTGGLISAQITSMAGVSDVYMGGIVSYSNDVKQALLGVSGETLKQFGAVSEKCVQELSLIHI